MFDNSGGKFIVANLVEIGDQVCKNGGKECGAADLTGFKVRSNTGAPWVDRKSGGKLDIGNVIPMKPTPFMDAVMTGSPDQVRQESYKQRVANIRALVTDHDGPERAGRGHRRRPPPAPTSGPSSSPLGDARRAYGPPSDPARLPLP